MKRFLCAFALAALVASPAFATDYLTGYVGLYDVSQGDNDSTEFGLEYRYKDVYYGLRPLAGGFINTDGGAYVYGGAQWDIPLSQRVIFSPNFAVGAYHEGDSKDLGYWLEFKSGIEMAYQFDDLSRVGVAFNHISNASLGDDNPGTENLIVNYSYPIGWAQ